MKTHSISMKTWGIVLCFIVIFVIFCSPGFAVTGKCDSNGCYIDYQSGIIRPAPDPTPTVIPTTMPTQAPSNCSYPPCMHYDPVPYDPVPTQTPLIQAIQVSRIFSPSEHSIQISVSYTKIKSSYLDSLSVFVPKKPVMPFSDNSFRDDARVDGPIKKPNIYLYSDRDLTAQVQLTPEKAITASEPAYQPGKGWLAQIRDGSLNGNGDFLFYEAIVPDSGWQKEEGYVIRAAYREQDMVAMLGPYGFNEKETVEFIEYWASHLIGDVDYVFYPLETDAVEQVMPLSVRPKPDHVMRIWFYAEPLITAPKPVTSPERIIREGFYIVEWGVFIDDEYEINHSAASSEVVL